MTKGGRMHLIPSGIALTSSPNLGGGKPERIAFLQGCLMGFFEPIRDQVNRPCFNLKLTRFRKF